METNVEGISAAPAGGAVSVMEKILPYCAPGITIGFGAMMLVLMRGSVAGGTPTEMEMICLGIGILIAFVGMLWFDLTHVRVGLKEIAAKIEAMQHEMD